MEQFTAAKKYTIKKRKQTTAAAEQQVVEVGYVVLSEGLSGEKIWWIVDDLNRLTYGRVPHWLVHLITHQENESFSERLVTELDGSFV